METKITTVQQVKVVSTDSDDYIAVKIHAVQLQNGARLIVQRNRNKV